MNFVPINIETQQRATELSPAPSVENITNDSELEHNVWSHTVPLESWSPKSFQFLISNLSPELHLWVPIPSLSIRGLSSFT